MSGCVSCMFILVCTYKHGSEMVHFGNCVLVLLLFSDAMFLTLGNGDRT